MSAISHLREMIRYMKEQNIIEQYEYYLIEETDEDFFKFSFYDFESFYLFITQEFNCYKMSLGSHSYLKAWYENGYCSPLCLLPEFTKNNVLYRTIECVSNCLLVDDNDHEIDVAYEDMHALRMNTLKHKIVVWYKILYEDEEDLGVVIRMPMICKDCISYTDKHLFHREMLSKVHTFQKNIRRDRCKATNTMEEYTLCEPMLKRKILQYLE